MALPATDNFSGHTIPNDIGVSASWTTILGSIYVQNAGDQGVCPNANNGESCSYWDDDSFNANQYSQAVVDAINDSCIIGVAVRASETDNYYGYYGQDTSSCLFKSVGASWTQLGSSGTGYNSGQTIRIEISGVNPGTITAKINGSTDTTVGTSGTASDSELDAGSAGICAYDDGTGCRVDNWEGGNVGGGPYASSQSGLGFSLVGAYSRMAGYKRSISGLY